MPGAVTILGILVMATALFLTPLGVPGLWIMVAVLALGAWLGDVSIMILGVCVTLAVAAEIAEFLIVQRLNVQYGGSRLAFWGAILGGVVGVILGMPVPVVGSIIAGFLGSFAGAALATLYETRRLDNAAAAKVAAGIVIFVLGSAALLL
jgi:uncharacterized protein